MTSARGYLPCTIQIDGGVTVTRRRDEQLVMVRLQTGTYLESFPVPAFWLTYDLKFFYPSPCWVNRLNRHKSDHRRRRTGSGYISATIIRRIDDTYLVVKLPTDEPIRVTVPARSIIWDRSVRDADLAATYAAVTKEREHQTRANA